MISDQTIGPSARHGSWRPSIDVDDWTIRQADEETRFRVLDLAVQTIGSVDATSGLVPETRQAVLDTAEVYLAWITSGARPAASEES